MTENDPDQSVEDQINALVEREHHLREHADGRGLDDAEHAELQAAEVKLDQLWDLLRRRRATRDAGGDTEPQTLRDAGTVENYLQ